MRRGPTTTVGRPPFGRAGAITLTLLVLLGAGGWLSALTPGGAMAASARGPAAPWTLASTRASVDAPNLSLVPSPAIGNAPLIGNVTAMISGGTPPYSLTLCFGTRDHSSATPNCAPRVDGWSGTSALRYPFNYSTPGNFSVVGIATDARGAGVGSTILVIVTSLSRLDVNPTESTGNGSVPLTVSLTVFVLGGTPPISIQWAFGDGTSGSSLNGAAVSHVYQQNGNFRPTVSVQDSAGHRVTRSLAPITVNPSAASSVGGAVDLSSTLQLIGLFAVGVGAVAIVARAVQLRRWRRQGNQLVDEMTETAEPVQPGDR